MNEIKLIALYFYVSERYEKELKYLVQRYSHNSEEPEFTDSELLALYIYVLSEEKHFQVKAIYRHARNYLLSWFPKLPSYQAFDHRACRLGEVMRALVSEWLVLFKPADCSDEVSIVDSYPIITCSAKRYGKVAREVTDKGCCATKGIYFYGVKLHVMGWQRPGHMPWIERVVCAEASQNDLTVFKQNWTGIDNRVIIGDKIYKDDSLGEWMNKKQHTSILMPVKKKQGKDSRLCYFDKAAEDLFSAAVSRVRQPIESLFNWINQMAEMQDASKVRSTNGLWLHIYGGLAAALFPVVINP